MITDRVPIKLGFEKLTADSPEYWGLAPICTDEQEMCIRDRNKRRKDERACTFFYKEN